MMVLIVLLCFQTGVSGKQEQNSIIKVNISSRDQTTARSWKGHLELQHKKIRSTSTENQKVNSSSKLNIISTEEEHHSLIYNEDFNAESECPTWMHYLNESDHEECVCEASHHGIVKCDTTLNKTYVLDCYQMTYNGETRQVIVGLSFYGCTNNKKSSVYSLVPANRSRINEVMCSQFNRDGQLCGACMDGYSPLVYSYQLYCMKCSEVESKYNWAKFIAMAFIPLTGFYILLVLLKINANSPKLHGLVFFAQLISSPANSRMIISRWKLGSNLTFTSKIISTLYGIWNLDFFRTLYPDTCLNISTLQALSLDYLIALYPMVLIIITYVVIKLHSMDYRVILWMWKPIRWCILKLRHAEDIKTSLIDIFATFLLLSYVKTLSVNFDLLVYTIPIDSNGKPIGRYLYYDANYEYFGPDHLVYGIIAIISFTIMNILPFILLLFYPMKWFQKLLNRFQLSHASLHIFFDSFGGCYKDGTEPRTRDCRYFAAFFLFIRIVAYIVYQATLTAAFYGWCSLIFIGVTMLLIVAKPYKHLYHKNNTITAVMFGVMAVITTSITSFEVAVIKAHGSTNSIVIVGAISAVLPLIYAIAIALRSIYNFKIFKNITLCKRCNVQRSLSESSLLLSPEKQSNSCQLLV